MTLLLLLIAAVPHDPVIRDTADLVEVNHYYDQNGEKVFDQLIFWEWLPKGTYRVFAWRMVKCPSQLPIYDPRRKCWAAVFRDRDQLRVVRSLSMQETWTQYDPELLDRMNLPQQQRRGLSVLRKRR